MFHRVRKHRNVDKIQVTWPEVRLDESELAKYFQFLLSPPVFVNQIPFLFGPPFEGTEQRDKNPPVH